MRCLFRSLFTFVCLPVAVSAVTLTMSPGQTARAADPSTFPAPTGDRAVLPPDSRLELLFDGACALTEGVAVAPDGMVYFSDITPTSRCKDEKKLYPQAGHIWKYDPGTRKASVFRSPSGMSNGLKFDAEGNLIAALGADYGGRMLIKTDMKTGKSYILTGSFNGKPYNALNDATIDEGGRIYFTDPRYLGHEPIEQPGYAVYRLDPDGKVHRIVTNGGKTNGVLVSPDQRRLYVISHDNGWFDFLQLDPSEPRPTHGLHALQVYELDQAGNASNRKVLVNYADAPGGACSGPDGMVADVDGNVYMALRCEHRPGIGVFSADGKELAFVSTGKELPTNVGFGRGADANLLYVTSGNSLYRIRMAKAGYHLPAK
jgi:gluconolactonase